MRMSAITSILDALSQRDWIRREPDPGDRRRTNVELTAAGRRMLERGRRLTSARLGTILDGYPGGRAELARAVDGLGQAVTRYDERTATAAAGPSRSGSSRPPPDSTTSPGAGPGAAR